MGKTSLVLNMCQHVATHGGVAGLFSLEMSKESLFMRMLASKRRSTCYRLIDGRDRAEGIPTITRAMETLSEAKLFVDDTAGIGALEMRAKARRLKAEHGLAVIAIDYIQLMTGRGRFENRTLELGLDLAIAQGPGQGAERARSSCCRSCRARRRRAPTSARCSSTCASRARSSRTPTWSC